MVYECPPSVRLLENHAFLWQEHDQDHSSLSSSSLHSTPAISSKNSRSLPKRNHTIGSIKYDSAAFNKVSFDLKSTQDDTEEDDDKQRLEDYVIMHQAKKPTTVIKKENMSVPAIVRSKSFSNDVEMSNNLVEHHHKGRMSLAVSQVFVFSEL